MNLKRFFPSEQYTFVTSLKIDKIRTRIADTIKRKGFTELLLLPPENDYTGYLSGKTFRLRRRMKNTIVITGSISEGEVNTKVYIKTEIALFIRVSLSIWFILLGIMDIAMIITGVCSQAGTAPGFWIVIFIPVAMFLLVYKLMIFLFRLESRKIKQFLVDLFAVEEILADQSHKS